MVLAQLADFFSSTTASHSGEDRTQQHVPTFKEALLEHNAGAEMDNGDIEESRPPYIDVWNKPHGRIGTTLLTRLSIGYLCWRVGWLDGGYVDAFIGHSQNETTR